MVVVPQLAAESFAAHNFTRGAAHFLAWLDQCVIEPLMVSLVMIMGQESNYVGTPVKNAPLTAGRNAPCCPRATLFSVAGED